VGQRRIKRCGKERDKKAGRVKHVANGFQGLGQKKGMGLGTGKNRTTLGQALGRTIYEKKSEKVKGIQWGERGG